MCRGLVAGLVLTALAPSARAQNAPEIRGTVRDSAFGQPVSGAIVQLLDSAAGVVSRTLTDQTGQYHLAASERAAWLQALRIGYRPRNRALQPDDTSPIIDIVMSRLPQRLEPVVVTVNNKCPRQADAGEAYALWDEARTGLLAAVVARNARPAAMRLINFTRRLRPSGRGIEGQFVALTDTDATQSFFAARGAPDFATVGFMREDSLGARAFFGPDADVLLDADFAATHCFSVAQPDAQHPGETGLVFEPINNGGRDSLVEVGGTLWLDRAAAALRTMEFQYRNLEPAAERAGVGGKESFLSLANGVTLISEWSIRFPVLDHAYIKGLWAGLHLRRSLNSHAHLLELYETGGQLASAVWPDSTSWHAKLPMIVGVVVDSVGRPIPGVAVAADSTNYRAVSGANGGFVMTDVLPGPYHLFATIGNLAPLGVRIGPSVDVDVRPDGDSARVRVEAQLGEDGRDFFCRHKERRGTVAFIGRLVNEDGTPGANLDVHVVWGGDTGANKVDVRSNAEGRFIMCGVPMQAPQLPIGSASLGARIMVFNGRTRVLNALLQLPSHDWIQGLVITLPSTKP